MVAGVIVRAYSWEYSNPMADGSLDEYLEDNEIVGITGVDTRALVRHIREKGVMNAVISSTELDEEKLVQMAKDWDDMIGLELASKVTGMKLKPTTLREKRSLKLPLSTTASSKTSLIVWYLEDVLFVYFRRRLHSTK